MNIPINCNKCNGLSNINIWEPIDNFSFEKLKNEFLCINCINNCIDNQNLINYIDCHSNNNFYYYKKEIGKLNKVISENKKNNHGLKGNFLNLEAKVSFLENEINNLNKLFLEKIDNIHNDIEINKKITNLNKENIEKQLIPKKDDANIKFKYNVNLKNNIYIKNINKSLLIIDTIINKYKNDYLECKNTFIEYKNYIYNNIEKIHNEIKKNKEEKVNIIEKLNNFELRNNEEKVNIIEKINNFELKNKDVKEIKYLIKEFKLKNCEFKKNKNFIQNLENYHNNLLKSIIFLIVINVLLLGLYFYYVFKF